MKNSKSANPTEINESNRTQTAFGQNEKETKQHIQ